MYSPVTREVAKARIDDWHRQAARYGRIDPMAQLKTTEGVEFSPGPRFRLALVAAVLSLFVVLSFGSAALALPIDPLDGARGGKGLSGKVPVCIPKHEPVSGLCRNAGTGELARFVQGHVERQVGATNIVPAESNESGSNGTLYTIELSGSVLLLLALSGFALVAVTAYRRVTTTS